MSKPEVSALNLEWLCFKFQCVNQIRLFDIEGQAGAEVEITAAQTYSINSSHQSVWPNYRDESDD